MKSGTILKIFLAVIKLTVFLACVVVGVDYLQTHQPDWNQIQLADSAVLIIVLLVFLAFVNWSLEALKWKYLMFSIESIGFPRALKATLSGVAVSFITPFRIGDFAGRIAHLKNHRKNAAVNTLYGNYAQLFTTALFGMTGLSIIYSEFVIEDTSLLSILLILGWSVVLMMIILYLLPVSMINMLRINSFVNIELIGFRDNKIKLKTLSLSILRYLVFVFQYFLCYQLFGSTSDWQTIVPLIMVMYLLITFVPSPVLGKLGVRESVSLFLLGSIENSAVILTASLFIWLINLFIPSVIGSIFLLRTGLGKSLNN